MTGERGRDKYEWDLHAIHFNGTMYGITWKFLDRHYPGTVALSPPLRFRWRIFACEYLVGSKQCDTNASHPTHAMTYYPAGAVSSRWYAATTTGRLHNRESGRPCWCSSRMNNILIIPIQDNATLAGEGMLYKRSGQLCSLESRAISAR